MKKVELLTMGCELLKMMSENGIKIDDYKYIELFKEYLKRRKNNEKYWVIIPELSDKYNISKSSCCRIIRRLNGDVKN